MTRKKIFHIALDVREYDVIKQLANVFDVSEAMTLRRLIQSAGAQTHLLSEADLTDLAEDPRAGRPPAIQRYVHRSGSEASNPGQSVEVEL